MEMMGIFRLVRRRGPQLLWWTPWWRRHRLQRGPQVGRTTPPPRTQHGTNVPCMPCRASPVGQKQLAGDGDEGRGGASATGGACCATSGFGICRPPGHHALPASPMGFCLLSTIAIAARYCQQAHALQRVAIFDFDVHHGNGGATDTRPHPRPPPPPPPPPFPIQSKPNLTSPPTRLVSHWHWQAAPALGIEECSARSTHNQPCSRGLQFWGGQNVMGRAVWGRHSRQLLRRPGHLVRVLPSGGSLPLHRRTARDGIRRRRGGVHQSAAARCTLCLCPDPETHC